MPYCQFADRVSQMLKLSANTCCSGKAQPRKGRSPRYLQLKQGQKCSCCIHNTARSIGDVYSMTVGKVAAALPVVDVHPPDEEDIYIGDAEFLDAEEDDINIVSTGEGNDADTKQFDQLVGLLSDVLLEEEFEQQREAFCKEKCQHFEDNNENKLIYMDLFQQYTQLIEAGIEARLQAAVPDFDMQEFLALLSQRQDELMSDVFDLLQSMGDFETFKELMLAYKSDKDRGSNAFQIQVCPVRMHTEEQEDGDVRPDLDCSLNISPVGRGHGAVMAL